MNIKNLPAAKNRAKQLEKQIWKLQSKLYDFQEDLKAANLYTQAQLAGMAAFELDESQFKIQRIYKKQECPSNTKA